MNKPKTPRSTQLVIRREHYIQLLSSGQVKPKARRLLRSHIGKLTYSIGLLPPE